MVISPINISTGGEFMNGIFTNVAAEAVVYSDITVALLGFGTVFFGLICIILLCVLFGRFFSIVPKQAAAESAPAVTVTQPAAQSAVQPEKALSEEERGAVVAAVSAAIAEELGTDVSAIRIHSFKKI